MTAIKVRPVEKASSQSYVASVLWTCGAGAFGARRVGRGDSGHLRLRSCRCCVAASLIPATPTLLSVSFCATTSPPLLHHISNFCPRLLIPSSIYRKFCRRICRACVSSDIFLSSTGKSAFRLATSWRMSRREPGASRHIAPTPCRQALLSRYKLCCHRCDVLTDAPSP